MIAREQIYSAVFAVFSQVVTFKTTSRRLNNFANVPSGTQPALFQLQAGEKTIPSRGRPPKRILSLELILYATANNPKEAPSTVLNPLLDAIDAALEPDPMTEVQTFGIAGVQHIWIEGITKIAEGVLENQAVAVIPVEILLA